MIERIIIPLDKKLADVLQLAIEKTFLDFFQIQPQFYDWHVENGPLALKSYIFSAIYLTHTQTNKNCGTMIVGFSRGTILRSLEAFGLAGSANEHVLNDAAEELVNIIFGMLKTSLYNKMALDFQMSFPFTDRQKMPDLSNAASIDKLVLPFSIDDHHCHLIFAQNMR